MTPEDATERYLRELKRQAETAGIDASRVVSEATDHLISARDRELANGRSPLEAEELALQHFGRAEDIVSDIALSRRENCMRTVVRRTGTLAGLIGAAVVMVMHIVPSTDIQDTLQETIGALSLAAIGVAAIALAFTALRRAILWGGVATMVVALGAYLFATSALFTETTAYKWPSWGSQPSFSDLAFYVFPLVVTAAVAYVARRRGVSSAIGIGLVVAASVSLLLSSVRSPAAGLGSGDANGGVSLMLLGWGVIAASQWSDTLGRWSAAVGALLVRVGSKMESRSARPTEAEI